MPSGDGGPALQPPPGEVTLARHRTANNGRHGATTAGDASTPPSHAIRQSDGTGRTGNAARQCGQHRDQRQCGKPPGSLLPATKTPLVSRSRQPDSIPAARRRSRARTAASQRHRTSRPAARAGELPEPHRQGDRLSAATRAGSASPRRRSPRPVGAEGQGRVSVPRCHQSRLTALPSRCGFEADMACGRYGAVSGGRFPRHADTGAELARRDDRLVAVRASEPSRARSKGSAGPSGLLLVTDTWRGLRPSKYLTRTDAGSA